MMTWNDYPDILTIEMVMGLLTISRGTCYALLSSGQLKGFKIGNKTWKIPKESIEEFINTNGYKKKERTIP